MSHSLQSKTSDCLVQSSSHFPSEFLRKMHSLAESTDEKQLNSGHFCSIVVQLC